MSHVRLSFRIWKPFPYLSNYAVWHDFPLDSIGLPYESLQPYVHLNCPRFPFTVTLVSPDPSVAQHCLEFLVHLLPIVVVFTRGYFWLIGPPGLFVTLWENAWSTEAIRTFWKSFFRGNQDSRQGNRYCRNFFLSFWIPILVVIGK